MEIRQIKASTPGLRLPVVLNEIAESLVRDDWCRMSTGDAARKYYIVGYADHAAEIDGQADFCCFEFPLPTRPGPLSEWAVRSQMGDNKPASFLAAARRNLEHVGITPAAIDRFLAGEDDSLKDFKFPNHLSVKERAMLLSHFFQAARLASADPQSIELDRDEKDEADIQREKMCLRQVAKKYAKIVDRWEQLERLTFDDPQMEEASATFLYGFYRATVVLSASAIETQLKRLLPGAPERAGPSDLLDLATNARLVKTDLADFTKDIFRYRNRVAHDNFEPLHDKAKEILGAARKVVAELRRL
jgi:hypothetical protein